VGPTIRFRRQFIGQTITLNGTPYTVVGVAPPNFKGIVSLGRPDVLWIPISMRDYVLTGQLKAWEIAGASGGCRLSGD